MGRTRKANGGFTLVEAAIVMTLLVVVLMGLTNVVSRAQGAAAAGIQETETVTKVHRVLNRVADELTKAQLSTITPQPDDTIPLDDFTYRQPVGVAGGVLQWSDTMRLALEVEQGEVLDGLDNNGDGRIDESLLVWTRDPGGPNEQRVVWCRGVRGYLQGETPNFADDNGNGLVDERGFSVQMEDGVLTLRLSLEGMGASENPFANTATTSVVSKN